MTSLVSARASQPTFRELFTPKLVTILREHYGPSDFRADIIAGLTVAIVALPLSMAIAIASGVSPASGLYAAIVGGFCVSALGGSRFQIGGPAGAFIVLVAATVQQHGFGGLLLATFLSGIILLAIGLLRLGTFIKYIPYPVTIGFTAGIAVIILASQLKEAFGLALPGPEPGPIIPKIVMLAQALPTMNLAALWVAITTIAIILAIRRFRPHWPGLLIAVAAASIATWFFGLPIETIGTRFGGIPHALPWPQLPGFSVQKVQEVLPSALSFALLGGIESLLSAVVADSMTGRRHRSNCELAAQGIANVASALFGGLCVTGTIARTATNVRAGARGPIAGMLHSVFLLLFMLVAAPLASFIPLAALAGVLAIVAWNMVEKHAFRTLLRAWPGEAVVLLATFFLVVFRDLTEGILVGFGLGALLFLHRMAQAVDVETGLPLVQEDRPDGESVRTAYDADLARNRDVIVLRISGAFFFGAAATIGAALDRLAEHPKVYVLDFSAVPMLDSTGATTIAAFVDKIGRRGAQIVISGAGRAVRHTLLQHGVRRPVARFAGSLEGALALVKDTSAGER